MKRPSRTSKKPRVKVTKQPDTPTKTEMIQSAAMWCEVFIPVLLQLIGERDNLSEESQERIVKQSRNIADLALNEYESRWSFIKLPI